MGQRERQEAALLASNPGAPNTPPRTHPPPTAQLYTNLPLIGPQTHLPLAVNSHIALHPEKAGHTGSHSTAPSTPLHKTHLLGPKGLPGMATGSTLGIC